jgi:hypothetical protein
VFPRRKKRFFRNKVRIRNQIISDWLKKSNSVNIHEERRYMWSKIYVNVSLLRKYASVFVRTKGKGSVQIQISASPKVWI